MSKFWRRRRCLVRVSAFAVAGVIVGTLPATGQIQQFNPPKQYYLALGDSIAYGYQASKARAGLPPSGFSTGYVDVFGARLQALRPGLTIVNYGCPGETTGTFITGPCVWTAFGRQLHDNFTGTQLDAAVAFLRAHPGEVSPITVTLWGNDVNRFVSSCADLACVQNGAPQLIAQISGNLAIILGRLRAEAPDAEIILTGSWDSFLELLAFADPLFQLLNASMSAVATAARVRFADPFPIFNPQGDLSAEIQAHCTMTLLCTEGDSHPSDAGYQALADLVFAVSGYQRFAVDRFIQPVGRQCFNAAGQLDTTTIDAPAPGSADIGIRKRSPPAETPYVRSPGYWRLSPV